MRHTVLLVDDEALVLGALRRLLRTEPYRVLATDDPAIALAWIAEQEISLVLSDLRMPGMPGDQFLREVRRVSPSTVRVLLTGYPGDEIVPRSVDGCVEFLIAKPWDDEELKATILRLLREREARAGADLAEDSATPRLETSAPQTDELLPVGLHRMAWYGPGRPAIDGELLLDPLTIPDDVSLVAGPAAVIAGIRTACLRLRTDPPRALISADGGVEWLLPDDLEIRALPPRVFHEIERRRASIQDSQSTRTRNRSWKVPGLRELAMRVECAGRTAREALIRMTDRFHRAELARTGLVLSLDGIEALDDSVRRLLRATALRVCVYGLRLTLLDPTGYLASFPAGRLPFRIVSPGRDPKRILIVNEHGGTAEFLHALLESAGHACAIARSAAEAVEKMEIQPFDSVVLESEGDLGPYLRMRKDVSAVRLVPPWSVSELA